ncbi:hypothetical protein [Polaromonas hydrogenivorans]|uniref:Uncharacterized protein n=1 Tax=Polaromonas hydrogenivorans TaxID=335476 RepID=A0AAU7LQK3_9BURK
MQRRTLLAQSLASAAVLALAGGAASGLLQVVMMINPESNRAFAQYGWVHIAIKIIAKYRVLTDRHMALA